MNRWYVAGVVLLALGGRLAYLAVRESLRQAGRTVDRLIAEEEQPVRYAAGVAAVPNKEGGEER